MRRRLIGIFAVVLAAVVQAPVAGAATGGQASAASASPAPKPSGGRVHLAEKERDLNLASIGQAPLQSAQPALPASAVGGAWTELGPKPIAPATWAGRVTSLALDPTGSGQVVYAGTAGGGVWKTTNGGSSWSTTTDNAAGLAIGAIAVSSNGTTVYAATGEANRCGDCVLGRGVLRSTDSGSTWTLVGGAYLRNRVVYNIVVSGANLLAATRTGLLISTDGGNTWSTTPVTGEVTALKLDPGTPGKVWAAKASCSTLPTIYTSTDNGTTWGSSASLSNMANRVALGVGSGGVAYAALTKCDGSGGLQQISKTVDGGTTFLVTFVPAPNPNCSTTTALCDYYSYSTFGFGSGGQGWYDADAAVDPANSSHAVFGGLTVVATNDGGVTWNDIARAYTTGVVHPDQHAEVFGPGGLLYIGCDGGVWKSTDLGGFGTGTPGSAAHWTNLNATLPTTQFYHGTALDSTHMAGGLQDNGTVGLGTDFVGHAAPPSWNEVKGGDGFFAQIFNGSTDILSEYPYGSMVRSNYSTGTTIGNAGPCVVGGDSACSDTTSFSMPFMANPASPSFVYAATSRVFRSTTGGSGGGDAAYPTSSPAVTYNGSTSGQDSVVSMAAAFGATTTLATGSFFGSVWVSNDADTAFTWHDATGNLPLLGFNCFSGSCYVNRGIAADVAINPANVNEMWVASGGIGATNGGVWHTTNANATLPNWTQINGSGGTAVDTTYFGGSILVDPNNPATIYLGTEHGVMVCTTCGGLSPSPSWSIMGTNLPGAWVTHLSLTADSATLVAWTHGRGAWSIPVLGSGPPPPPAPNVFSQVSRRQYTLHPSDGQTWMSMDDANLTVSFTPTQSGFAVLTGNSDLWTSENGNNQDIGIFVSDNGSPYGNTPLAWKESGGFAGTFSPNAAFVQGVLPVQSGHNYSATLKWKANHQDNGTIWAGAGPLVRGSTDTFSPTRITAWLNPLGVASQATTHQNTLTGSDGQTWQEIDPSVRINQVPSSDQFMVVTGNADLWTSSAGYNQDIGIFLSTDGGPDVIQAWKESGGFAGTFSPNAAAVEAPISLPGGHSYLIKLKWKSNNPDSGTIWAGAGPLVQGSTDTFSPTSLFAVPVAPPPSDGVWRHQPTLTNSDGVTWQDIDATNLSASVTPSANGTYLINGNADLWTSYAGDNQDIALSMSDGGGADQIIAWKESGGFAGTFSPNAAFVQTVVSLTAGHTYLFKLKWKANHAMNSQGKIWAGAGPLTQGTTDTFSPSRVTVIQT